MFARSSLGLLTLLSVVACSSEPTASESRTVPSSQRLAGTPITGATVTMGANTRLSASIYDANGQVIRHLYELAPKTGTVALSWDGKDDDGYLMPSATYNWRAIASNITGADDGFVGDSGRAVAGHPYAETQSPGRVEALTYDASGNLYLISDFEEGGGTLLKIDSANLGSGFTGLTAWRAPRVGEPSTAGQAIATDGSSVYIASGSTISRVSASTGAALTGGVPSAPVFPWTDDELGIPGMAVDSAHLWVSDPRDNRVLVFNKTDGSPANIIKVGSSFQNWFTVQGPRGIATDGNNNFWIVSTGTPPVFANSDFEVPALTPGGYQYYPGSAGWTFTGTSGVQSNGSAWNAALAPSGVQTAYLQGGAWDVPGTMSQTVNFVSTGSYSVVFSAAARNSDPVARLGQPIAVKVDGVQVGHAITPILVHALPFATYRTPWFRISSPGNHTITFAATEAETDQTTFIDHVAIEGGAVGGATKYTLDTITSIMSPVGQTSASTPIDNNGLESLPVGGGSGFQYNPAGASWTFVNTAGVQANGGLFGAPAAPEGTQTAFLQGAFGEPLGSMSQNVSFTAAGTYSLSLEAAGRSAGSQPIAVKLDGVQVGSAITPPVNVFTHYSVSFTVSTPGEHTLSLHATNNSGGDLTTFVDAFAINGGESNLENPYGIAWARVGASSTLYVSEVTKGRVHRFDVSGATPVESASWFGTSLPGTVSDTTFAWSRDLNYSWVPSGDAAIAVAPDGQKLGVVDVLNGRTLFYNTTDGSPAVTPRFTGITASPAPDVDVNIGEDVLTSGYLQYQISHGTPDSDYGHPWSITHNWQPTDDVGQLSGWFAARRKLSNGKEYLYYYVTSNDYPWGAIVVYQVEPTGPGSGVKRSAAIYNVTACSLSGGPMRATTDTNGTGIVGDGGDLTSSRTGCFGPGWVDSEGTIWLSSLLLNYDNEIGIGRLPIASFDSQANPVYDVNAVARVNQVPGNGAVGSLAYQPLQVRHDTVNDRVFAQVNTGRGYPTINGGGTGILMLDRATGQTSIFQIPTHTFYSPTFASDHTPIVGEPLRSGLGGLAVDSDGKHFFTGDNMAGGPEQEIRMFTWDGLPLAIATPSAPEHSVGWLDHGLSLAAFTHSNGKHYVYAEDIYYGRLFRYAFSNVSSSQRFGSDPHTNNTAGAFSWASPNDLSQGLVGWWRMDEQKPGGYVIDSSGNGRGGQFANGLVAPVEGRIRGARLFSSGPMVFAWETNVPTPDSIIEGNAVLTFATWIKTTASGVVLSYQDVQWGSTPTAYWPAVYVGQDGKLYGGVKGASAPIVSASTINDDAWHHVALVVGSLTQTLYLDGSVVGSVSGGKSSTGQTFTLFGGGTTLPLGTATWPQTPAGAFPFNGMMDDVRVYSRALTAAEIGALAAPTDSIDGPVAHWKFDETIGVIASDSSDHGNDANVAGATWVPGHIDGALSFDGSSTVAVLPDSLVENPAYSYLSFATWLKTSASGVILEYQNGRHPKTSALPQYFYPMLYIDSDGKAKSYVPPPACVSIPTPTCLSAAVSSASAVNDGLWHHIALVVGKTALTIYVDGAVSGSQTMPFTWYGLGQTGFLNNQIGSGYFPPGSTPLGALSWPISGWNYYAGILDDAQFYGRELSPTEIATLAAQ